MIRPQIIKVRKCAKRGLLFNNFEHAIYGVSYVNDQGCIIEEFAKEAKDIKYFRDDYSFLNCVESIEDKYKNKDCLNIYSVHKKNYTGI